MFESVLPRDFPEVDDSKAQVLAPGIIVNVSNMTESEQNEFAKYTIKRMYGKEPWLMRE